ncbi:hypothetical protein N9B94_01650 [Verrucomicrobia bacterium]|nr:hypothetical protein [Verrucomicrobiota bacterium]
MTRPFQEHLKALDEDRRLAIQVAAWIYEAEHQSKLRSLQVLVDQKLIAPSTVTDPIAEGEFEMKRNDDGRLIVSLRR